MRVPNVEQHVVPVTRAVPPSKGKSTPLPRIRAWCETPRSSRMSPTAATVYVVAGSQGRLPSVTVMRSGQSPSAVTRFAP
jgi:hypothetical protein